MNLIVVLLALLRSPRNQAQQAVDAAANSERQARIRS